MKGVTADRGVHTWINRHIGTFSWPCYVMYQGGPTDKMRNWKNWECVRNLKERTQLSHVGSSFVKSHYFFISIIFSVHCALNLFGSSAIADLYSGNSKFHRIFRQNHYFSFLSSFIVYSRFIRAVFEPCTPSPLVPKAPIPMAYVIPL